MLPSQLRQITRPAGLEAFTDTLDVLDWSKQLCAHANTHLKSAECPFDSQFFPKGETLDATLCMCPCVAPSEQLKAFYILAHLKKETLKLKPK